MAMRSPNPSVQRFIESSHGLLIGNDWRPPEDGGMIDVEDPATATVISRIARGGRTDVDRAVACARAALEKGSWPSMTPSARTQLLLRFTDLLEQHADELAEIESIDGGKPLSAARNVDIALTTEMFRYMAGATYRLNGETMTPSSPGEWLTYTRREPVGVVAQIVPWNFPLLLAAWKMAPALAAGCTIVLKPSELTSLSALRLGQLALEAGFPAGVINIVTGYGHEVGTALASHPDIDKISFTGSATTGRSILTVASGNFKRVMLELGGKSPSIVFADADLDLAIPGVAGGIFDNAGQVCTAGSLLFVHRAVYDKVIDGLQAIMSRHRLGHGLDTQTTLGPLISARQYERVQAYIDGAAEDGAEILSCTQALPAAGHFMRPTILAGVDPAMPCVREEIFGPVLSVQMFEHDDLDRVGAAANNSETGLAATIWSRDISICHRLANRLKAGTVWINTHGQSDAAVPFGGYKQSGWGRERGDMALQAYLESKSVVARL